SGSKKVSVEPGNAPGNTANYGWVVEGGDGETYVGTEHGLFRIEKDGSLYRYTPYPALWLNRYGEYLVYIEFDSGYDSDGTIKAFDLTPLSEPYPIDTIDTSTGFLSVDESTGMIYYMSRRALFRADLFALDNPYSFTPPTNPPDDILLDKSAARDSEEPNPEPPVSRFRERPIGWSSQSTKGGDAAPAPHEAPSIPALSDYGIFTVVSMSGARYEEFVYVYDFDGGGASQYMSDIAARNMFYDNDNLFFSYDDESYDSYEDYEPGIYMIGGNNGGVIFNEGDVSFNVHSEPNGKLTLVLAGNGGIDGKSGRIGVYSAVIDAKNFVTNEPKLLYDGLAINPNIADGWVYFIAEPEREDELFSYYRVPIDGSSGVEKLDFENEKIVAIAP
ncbi:MAG: hypothetical protein LBN43_07375, partial [Oscillospiraceae bacterium]|nr:hypothetical protein [Oscillospiraceae bacterium]